MLSHSLAEKQLCKLQSLWFQVGSDIKQSQGQGLTLNENHRINRTHSRNIQIWESISLFELHTKCSSFSEILFLQTKSKVNPCQGRYVCLCRYIPFLCIRLHSVGLGLHMSCKMCVDFTVNLKLYRLQGSGPRFRWEANGLFWLKNWFKIYWLNTELYLTLQQNSGLFGCRH